MAMVRQAKTGAALALALAIGACSAPPGTSPTERNSQLAPPGTSSEESGMVRLSGEDIRTTGPDGERIAFGAERIFTERVLGDVLGSDIVRATNRQCGAGPVETSAFDGGLTLNFQRGYLVGWFLREGGAGSRIATAEGITVGSPIADARKVYSIDPIEGSTLGSEFSTDEGFGVIVTDTDNVDEGERRIAQLYAGTNCFAR